MSAMKSLAKGFSNKFCLLFSVWFVFKGREEERKSRKEKKEKSRQDLGGWVRQFHLSQFPKGALRFSQMAEERTEAFDKAAPRHKLASQVAVVAKNLPANSGDLETRVQSPGPEDPLEKGTATHSSILVWRIPWTEEPCRLQSTGSQRVGYDWATWS